MHPNETANRGRTTRRRLTALAATSMLAVLLSACGGLTKDNPSPAGAEGISAASFTARNVAGGSTTLPGDRPSVLLFFSVECGGCGPTAQGLAQAQAQDPKAADFAVVDVAAYETAKDIEGFLKDYDATALAFASDPDGTLIARYGVTQLSTVVIVDPDGKVVFRGVEPNAAKIRAELDKVTG